MCKTGSFVTALALCTGFGLCTTVIGADSKKVNQVAVPNPATNATRVGNHDRAFSNGPGGSVTMNGAPRGGGESIHSGLPACDDLGVCDLQVGVTGGFTQDCPVLEGDWVSLAFPVQTDGAVIGTVTMTHNTNAAGGHLYLLDDCGGNPDVGEVLYAGCDAIVAGTTGQVVYDLGGGVQTNATTWVVAVFSTSFSFDVAYNSSVPDTSGSATGLAFGNLSGSGASGSWTDLSAFAFGFCYCVEVGICEAASTCCEGPLCDGDANGDGIVDPLDGGYAAARFGTDVNIPGNCQADVNCDGVIDPLDGGYILARFGTCNPPILCAPGGGECGPGSCEPANAAPVNDNCADATVVLEGSTAFDTSYATTDGPVDCDAFTGNNDVWFRYTSPAAGNVLLSTCSDIGFDGTLSVYSGTSCVGANLGCNDDGCGVGGGGSELFIPVTSGQVITIRAGGWDDGTCGISSRGMGSLSIDHIPTGQGACCHADETCTTGTSASCTTAGGTFQGANTSCTANLCLIGGSNDVCADVVPTPLNAGETITFMGDNTTEAVDDCATFFELEVWEAFTTTESMNVTVDYCGTGVTFSPVWGYIDSSCPCGSFIQGEGGAFLLCENGETQFTMTFTNLEPGTYYHPVYASADGTLGPYTINVTGFLPPADCCIAHPQAGCDEIDGVPAPGVEDCVCGFDPTCCETTWDEFCVLDVEFFGCADCPDEIPPPANDECDGATALECDTTDTVIGGQYTTNAADKVSTCELANGGPFTKDTSWWYTVTVPAGTTSFTLNLCDSSGDDDNDSVVTVFSRTSTCGALTQLKCDDDLCTAPSFGPSIVTVTSPVAGDDYLVLVDVYAESDPNAEYVVNLTCVP